MEGTDLRVVELFLIKLAHNSTRKDNFKHHLSSIFYGYLIRYSEEEYHF